MIAEKTYLLDLSEGQNELRIWKSETPGKYHGSLTFDVTDLKNRQQWMGTLEEKGISISNDADEFLYEENDHSFTCYSDTFIAEFTLYQGIGLFSLPPTAEEILLLDDVASGNGNVLLGLALRILLSNKQIVQNLGVMMLIIMEGQYKGNKFDNEDTAFLNPNAFETGENLGAYVANPESAFPRDAMYIFLKEFKES